MRDICRFSTNIPHFLFQFKCAGIQLMICALSRNQIGMTSPLYNSSVIQHHDHIRIHNGRQTVRNNKHRTPFHQFIHTPCHD